MSKENNLELMTWGDGTVNLAHWDSLHGDDLVIEIESDGKAYKVDAANDAKEPINLAAFLYQLAKDKKW